MTNTKNTELFESASIPKAVRTMALPTVMGQLIVLIYSLADTFFIGRTNNKLMVAAASLILPVFNITMSLAGLSGIGGGALFSRLLGKKDYPEAKKVCNFSIWLSIFISGVFSLLTLIFCEPLLSVLGANSDTYGYARAYSLCVIVAGGIPTVLSNVLAMMIRSSGESRKAAFGITLGGVLNMALDPLFMFVILPKGYEVIGAGIATAISNCISCIFFFYTIKKLGEDSCLHIGTPFSFPKKENIIKVFTVGIPSSLATLLFDLDYVIIDKLMTSYNDTALAAIGIVLKAERLPLNVGIGICQGMMPIVAYNFSSGNHKRMEDTVKFSRRLGLACAAFSITLYEIFSPYIMRFFINDAETVALGTDFLRIRALATVLMFLSFFHVYLFNSYGEGATALFLGVTRWAVFNIPMLFILNNIFGMYGIVWSQLAADILTVTLSFIVHFRFKKKLAKKENAL